MIGPRQLPLLHRIVKTTERVQFRRGDATTMGFITGRRPVGGTAASYNVRFRGQDGGGVTTTRGDFEPGLTVMMSRNEAGHIITGLPPSDKRATESELNYESDVSTGKLF